MQDIIHITLPIQDANHNLDKGKYYVALKNGEDKIIIR